MNHDWVYPEIGKMVAQRRKTLGMTQEDLAPQIGLSRTSLANIERGRQKVLVHQLFALASALQMETADLLPKAVRRMATNSDVKFSQQLSGHQRAQLAQLLGDDPTPTERENDARKTRR